MTTSALNIILKLTRHNLWW